MKSWRLAFFLCLLLGFLIISSTTVVFAAEPYFDFPTSGLGDKVTKQTPKETAKDLWAQEIFVKNYPGDKVADWYKTEGEKAGWKVEAKQKSYNVVLHITKGDLFFEAEIQWGLAVREDPQGRREEDSSITVEWGPKSAFGNYYGVFPLKYPPGEAIGEIKEITSPFLGQEQKFKTTMQTTVVADWYEKKLAKVSWQTEGLKMNRSVWSQTFTRGEEKLVVSTENMMADPMIFTLQWNEKEEKKIEEMDLKTLISNYYYFRHLANERMGWNYWGWSLGAIFPEQVEAIKNTYEVWQERVTDPSAQIKKLTTDPLGFLKEITGLDETEKKFKETQEFLGKVWEMGVVRKDAVGAACEIGNYAVEKQDAGPLGTLLAGGAYTECLINRTKGYYQKTQEKLKAEDPNYCVFKENYQGQDYCYQNWFDYWKVFHPQNVAFSMLTSVPRGLDAYNEAAKRWQEKTKLGEFSDGSKYTVKEIIGEDWQDAFEDMGWTTQRYEITIFKSEEKKETPSPTTPKEKARIEGTKVYLGEKMLLDAAEFTCFGISEILYAPTDDYFLVIVGCLEGDNLLFLSRADGSDKKEITGKLDVLNYEEVEWAADGQSFTYHRINGFGYDKKTLEMTGEKNPPEEGMIKYDIATGQKTLVGSYKPVTAAPTASPKTETGEMMTVSEFNNLPNPGGFYGCGFSETDPKKPILMQLKVTSREAEELSEGFIKAKGEGETMPLFEACSLYSYQAEDSTGQVRICVLHCDPESGECVLPSKKLEIGKEYLLAGCRPYIGTGGPGPGPIFFGVREDWGNAIVEK